MKLTTDNTATRLFLHFSSEEGNLFLVVVTIVLMVTPNFNSFIIIRILLLLLWYLYVLLFESYKIVKGYAFALLLGFWFLWELFLKLINFSTASIGNYFTIISFYDVVIKSLYIRQAYSKKSRERLFRLIQVVILLNVITNIYQGLLIPNVHTLNIMYPELYKGKNIAGTVLYNMLAFYIGTLLFDCIVQKRILIKLFDLSCILISLYFMLAFEARSTALFLTVCLVVLVIYNSLRSLSSKFVFCGLATILVVVLLTDFNSFVVKLIPFFPERVGLRLSALVSVSNSNGFSQNAYLARFELLHNSIETFLSSASTFIYGIGYHLGQESYSMIGQHSLLTDYMARYGCMGIAFLLVFFNRVYRYILYSKNNKLFKSFGLNVLIVYLVTSVMSNSFNPALAIAAIMLPSLIIARED